MNVAFKNLMITGAVFSAAVLGGFGGSSHPLEAGENQTPVLEIDQHKTQGVVVKTTYFSVKLKSEQDGLVTFYIPEKDKLTKHEIGQLLRGDRVTIRWSREEGTNWVRDVAGDGELDGKVSAVGDAWVEVEDKDHHKTRFTAPWRGGNPADGGGPDRDVVRKLDSISVGEQVSVSWALDEGKRVREIRKRGKSEPASKKDDAEKSPKNR